MLSSGMCSTSTPYMYGGILLFCPKRCGALCSLFFVYFYSELYLYDFGVYVCAVYALQLLVWQRHHIVYVTEVREVECTYCSSLPWTVNAIRPR